jgi:hypothetical protein
VALTSRVHRETETLGAQVPMNGIELAIARCNELEKSTRSTSVAGETLHIFMLKIVRVCMIERVLAWKVDDFYPATLVDRVGFSSSFRCRLDRFAPMTGTRAPVRPKFLRVN